MERTLAIIKPDATGKGMAGKILDRILNEGFTVKAMKMVELSGKQAQGFYAVHRERPFFDSLTDFMTSGPVVVMILEADGAIAKWRSLMGATDPAEAAPGTLRKDFGEKQGKKRLSRFGRPGNRVL